MVTGAGDGEPEVLDLANHVVTVRHQSLFNPWGEGVGDQGADVLGGALARTNRRRGELELVGRGRAFGLGPIGILRIGKAELGIDHRSKIIIDRFGDVAGWSDVEALAGGQFHSRGHEVQLVVAGVRMTYEQDVVLVFLKTCERHLFEPIHDGLLLFWGNHFTRGKAQYTGGVLVF
jgi:hypothetical protein